MSGATKLMTSGGGGVSLTPASSISSDVTVQIPAASGTVITTASSGKVIPTAALPAGTVLQVVQVSNSTQSSTTSASYVASNLSATITPTASTSKILVIVNAVIVSNQLSSPGFGAGLALYRGASAVFTDANRYDSAYMGPYGNYIGSVGQRTPLVYLDAPLTTAATTYTLYFTAYQGTSYISKDGSTANITLMEIAA